MAKLSWATVARVDGRAIELGLGDRPPDLTRLRWIGVVPGGLPAAPRLARTSRPRTGKIAVLRYKVRGYRDPEYFKLKIFQRCSLPDNPWAHIVL